MSGFKYYKKNQIEQRKFLSISSQLHTLFGKFKGLCENLGFITMINCISQNIWKEITKLDTETVFDKDEKMVEHVKLQLLDWISPTEEWATMLTTIMGMCWSHE